MEKISWKSEPAAPVILNQEHLEQIKKYVQQQKICDTDCYQCRVMGKFQTKEDR